MRIQTGLRQDYSHSREKICKGKMRRKGRGLSISIEDEIVAKDRLCFSQTYDRPSKPDPANPGDSVIHI